MKPAQTINLPSAYSLALPPRLGRLTVERSEAPAAGPLPASDEPTEIFQAFHGPLGDVANQAGLEPVNVFHRATQLMAEIASAVSWWRTDETDLRAMLQAADLEFVYTRPRTALAQMAVAWVVAELIDASRLRTEQLASLERLLRDHDPSAISKMPIRRPIWVPSLDVPEGYRPIGRDWIRAVDPSGILPRTTTEGFLILAETTGLTRLDMGRPTEERKSLVVRGGVKDQQWTQPTDVNSFISEYFNLPLAKLDHSSPLIIRNEAYWRCFSFDNWLALNPVYGFACGWLPSSLGLMRWMGLDDEIMVESIRWQDGAVRGNRLTRDEVGEGWQVVASPAAVDQLKVFAPHLERMLVVERSFKEPTSDLYSERVIRREALD